MHPSLITDLAIVTMVAAATGLLTRRFGQPSVLGYLLAGLLVGPYIPVPLFADPGRMEELAEVGVVLVMFAIGLEFRLRRLLEVLPVSGLAALVQMGTLFLAGFTLGSLLGWDTIASLCLGASVAISSTMVVSSVLKTRPVDPDIRSHIFGILVVQDVVAIILIAVVTTLAAGQALELQSLGLLIGQLTGVVVAMLVVGLLVLPRLVRYALRQSDRDVTVVLVAGAAFGFAMLAGEFGYSVALGAFIAGMAVAESGRGHDVELAIDPLRALFSAIFFVSIGMSVNPVVVWSALPLIGALCAIVIAAQFVSVMVGSVLSGGSLRRGVYSGLALGQIGELSFILAGIAIAGDIVPAELLPALVAVATVTAFTTPFLLSRTQPILHAVDHLLPDRLQQALAAYQAFIRRSPTGDESVSFRRPAFAVLLDWGALMVLFVTHRTVAPLVRPDLKLLLHVGTALVALPFMIGLVRSGLRAVAIVETRAHHTFKDTARARAVVAVGWFAVAVVIGLPTLALLRPLNTGPWDEVVLTGLLLSAGVLLGLRLSRLDGEHTSGVARMALELTDQVGTDEEADASLFEGTGPLAGLDYRPFRIEENMQIAGQTLADLDLRCRSGATVVAIRRDGGSVVLPTGHEQLQAGDTLALSGSDPSLRRAENILHGRGESENAAAA